MASDPWDGELPAEQVAARVDRALRRMIATPPQPKRNRRRKVSPLSREPEDQPKRRGRPGP